MSNVDLHMSVSVLENLSIEQLIDGTINAAKKMELKLAVCKQASWKRFYIIIDFQPSNPYEKNFHKGRPGFVFVDFNRTESSTFITADLLIKITEKKVSVSWATDVSKNLKHAFTQLVVENKSFHEKREVSPLPHHDNTTEKKRFLDFVTKAQSEFKTGLLDKVIAARKNHKSISSNFSVAGFFSRLTQNCSDELCSIVHIPSEGLWIGATPELLLDADNKRIARTVALAGTIKKEDRHEETGRHFWTDKEIREHALVSQYISTVLKKRGYEQVEESQVYSYFTAHLFHLKKDFRFKLNRPDFSEVKSLIHSLHPTPAICGLPQKEAHAFIQSNEHFHRSYYCGYLGPVNIEKRTSVYVNIRCMHISGSTAVLYAGAGITSESDPAMEWEETNQKLKVMAKILDEYS